MTLKKNNFIIDVRNEQHLVAVDVRKIKDLARAVLRYENVTSKVPIELSITFVGDRRIRNLNKKYHEEDKATDVLAFPIDIDPPLIGSWILGEIAVSTQTAKRQSKIFDTNFKEEVALYCIHGLLHLLGYRDDVPRLKKKMWERQDQIMKKAYRGI